MVDISEGAKKALLKEISQLSESAVKIGDTFYTSDTIIEAFYNLTPDQKGKIWDRCKTLNEKEMIFAESFYMERTTYMEQWAFTDEPVFFYSLVEVPAQETYGSRLIERRPLSANGFSQMVDFFQNII